MLTPQSPTKLFLIDAYALIFRAYFAFSKNPRINSKGFNTSAVFGFVNALLDIIQNEVPTHIAVAFDPSTPLKRNEIFPDYKANREATPEDIKSSVPFIKDILKALNIPILIEDGYEADDIIGTIAHDAADEGYKVYMMTPDKDFAQLIRPNVYLYKPARMGNAAEIWGKEEVCGKFEVKNPIQVIDILGLWGDAVDNIPGVPGIGEKTAKKLIGAYGSIEGVYDHIDELKGKQKQNLIDFKKQALTSKELATIDVSVPIEYALSDFVIEEANMEKLIAIFDELEFRSLTKRLGSNSQNKDSGEQISMFDTAAGSTSIPQIPTLENTFHNYQLVDNAEKLDRLIADLSKLPAFCFDTETSALDYDQAELIGIAFSYKKGEGYYVPCFPGQDTEIKIRKLKPLFENPGIEKVAHNLKFDLRILNKYGVEEIAPSFDTMIAHYLIEPDNNRRSMDLLSETVLNYKPKPITELIGPKGKNQKSMTEVPIEELKEYAAEDSDITFQLRDVFKKEMADKKVFGVFTDIEMPLVPVLMRMEKEGIKLDKEKLSELSSSLADDIIKFEKEIYELAGSTFNIGSPKQVGEVLFEVLKIHDKPKKTKSGQYATNEEVLKQLESRHPIVPAILSFRELQKLKNTYVDSLPTMINPNTGRIHTTFNQVVAATGRLSSDKPNLQNIPIRTEKGRAIRKAFVPRDENHILIAADYSQIELRIIASISGDKGMIEAFNAGQDIHASTASKVFGVPLSDVTREQRSSAKTVNFGIIYGISAFGLSQRVGISRTEAKDIIDNYFEQFPGIKDYMDKTIAFAREHGYVQTITGRRRYLRDINSRNAPVRGFAERNAINSPIQGSAADMIKLAMIKVDNFLHDNDLKTKMILQVHDELLFDAPLNEAKSVLPEIKKIMSAALQWDVPISVDAQLGNNWLEAH
ncbi:MAG TPA: DNA polymerase I [Flavobacteriales bacterium]|jgi:DNA polymerase-1|nr:DNA polymerase I [Flavobacteriales bacterium]